MNADALMQRLRGDLEDAIPASARASSRLLDDKGDRICLVEQMRLPSLHRVLGVARIQEHAAAHQDAVRLRDQRGDPAHVEIPAARAALSGQALVDVALDRRLPEAARPMR